MTRAGSVVFYLSLTSVSLSAAFLACGNSSSGGNGVDAGVVQPGGGTVAGCPTCAVLFDGIANPSALAVDEEGVFFIATDVADGGPSPSKLRHVDRSGIVTVVAELGSGAGLALTSDAVFVSGAYPGVGAGILKFSRSNLGAPPTRVANLLVYSAVAIADGFVYFGGGANNGQSMGSLLRCPLTGCDGEGGAPEVVIPSYNGGYPRRIAAGGNGVFFSAIAPLTTLFHVDLSQATKVARVVDQSQNGIGGFFVKDGSAYYIDGETPPSLVRCALPACTSPEPVAEIGDPGTLAADGTDVYYGNSRSLGHLTLDPSACDGGSCTNTVMGGLTNDGPYADAVRLVAVDKSYVYWMSGDESIGNVDSPVTHHRNGVLMRQPR